MSVYRFLEYRQAIWFEGVDNLETRIRDAYSIRSSTSQRIVERADGSQVMGLSMRDYNNWGVFLHCARYVDDQPTGVVPMDDRLNASLEQRRPGNSENFSSSDFFALVLRDHVITLNAHQNAAALASYLQGLFRLAEMDKGAGMFNLFRIANADKMSKIQASGGVEMVQLDVTIEEAVNQAVID